MAAYSYAQVEATWHLGERTSKNDQFRQTWIHFGDVKFSLFSLLWIVFLLGLADDCLIPHEMQREKKSLKKSQCSQSTHKVFVE